MAVAVPCMAADFFVSQVVQSFFGGFKFRLQAQFCGVIFFPLGLKPRRTLKKSFVSA